MPSRRTAAIAAVALLLAACAGSAGTTTTTVAIGETATTVAGPAATEAPTTQPPTESTEEAPATTDAPATTVPAAGAMEIDGDVVTIAWDNLGSTPFYAPAAGGGDPFFHIHTNPDADGFFLSFELYTTGYGQQWTGETGTFDISCADPVNSTGICPYFDADGPGPEPVKGDDFAATGSLTIVQLDDVGYEIVIHELVFSDGTTFSEFTMSG